MANAIFEAIEKAVLDLGIESDGSVDLSELSLIGKGEERVIGFGLLGSNFLLTPEGEVVAVDGTEDDAETYALGEDMKLSAHRFLKWRFSFIQEFGL